MAAACDFWQKEHFVIANFLFPNSAENCSPSPYCFASLNKQDPMTLPGFVKRQ